MSDSNRVAIAFIEETTFGQTPASALQELRKTSESLVFNIENITSNEIRSDRQTSDLIQTGAESGGGFELELSYGAYDDLMEGALWNKWPGSVLTVTGTDISTTGGGGTSTLAKVGNDFPAFALGQWIEVRGFTGNAANNGYFQISKTVAPTASLITLQQDVLVTEAAGDSVTVKGDRLVNGVQRISYTLEKNFQDLSPQEFFFFQGMVVDTLSLSVAANEIMTGSFAFLGTKAGRQNTTIGTGAYTPPTTAQVLSAVTNVGQIQLKGAPLAADVFVQDVAVEIGNNVRGDSAIGTLGFVNVSGGTVSITGTMTVIWSAGASSIYDDYLQGAETSFSFNVEDAAGNAYIFTIPRMKFTTAEVLAGGINQTTVMSMGFQGILDPQLGHTFQVDRFAA